MDNQIKNFIQENESLIENNEWKEVYEKASGALVFANIGELTQTLLQAGIDPLEYLDYIPKNYLSYADIKSFIIPNHIKSIGNYAFHGCSKLTSVKIGNSVTSIGYEAFHNCDSLTEITIPDSVTSIGHGAFAYCNNLSNINYAGTIEKWNAISKGRAWNYDVLPSCKVICTNGEVNIHKP